MAGKSDPIKVARTIVAFVQEDGSVEVRAIAPPAVNQAVKAIAVARSYYKDGDLIVRPSFGTTDDIVLPGANGSNEVSLLILAVELGPQRTGV